MKDFIKVSYKRYFHDYIYIIYIIYYILQAIASQLFASAISPGTWNTTLFTQVTVEVSFPTG